MNNKVSVGEIVWTRQMILRKRTAQIFTLMTVFLNDKSIQCECIYTHND